MGGACLSQPVKVKKGVPRGWKREGEAAVLFVGHGLNGGTSCHQVGMMSRAGGQLLRLDRVKILPDREKGCGLGAGKHQIML